MEPHQVLKTFFLRHFDTQNDRCTKTDSGQPQENRPVDWEREGVFFIRGDERAGWRGDLG
jgi:hypothetical protein